jgi:hypothetical protein
MMLAPSKMMPSFPPTRFTKTMGSRADLARCETISQRTAILPLLKGDALIETSKPGCISINSCAGSFG